MLIPLPGKLSASTFVRLAFVRLAVPLLALALLASVPAFAQQSGNPLPGRDATLNPELAWVPFGNRSIVAGVAGVASGPVDRVWFGDGGVPFVLMPGGAVYRSIPGGSWAEVANPSIPEPLPQARVRRVRSSFRMVLSPAAEPTRAYALGDQLYRSDDAGTTWTGLTRYRGHSLLGELLNDLAIHPSDPNDLLIASDFGLWRSRDGGLSWFQAGSELPAFRLRRILSFPKDTRGLRAELIDGRMVEWVPGTVRGWQLESDGEEPRRRTIPAAIARLRQDVVDWVEQADQLYLSLASGAILSSGDRGNSWREFSAFGIRSVSQFQVDPSDSGVALALATSEAGEARLLRTLNGGAFWEDWSPTWSGDVEAFAPVWQDGLLYAVASGAVYRFAADFRSASLPRVEAAYAIEGLKGRVRDLRLDPSGTLLFAATDGYGLFTLNAPGPGRSPLLRNAANLGEGAAAPGSLLSVYGDPLRSLSANGRPAALLGDSGGVTQVQLPYNLRAGRVELNLETDARRHTIEIPLRRAAPAVFVHPDGNPFVLNAENGAFMDENNPLRPGEAFQLLVTGLGAVNPQWPEGMAAPLDDPPAVTARVDVFVNGVQVPVTKATLAPGYAGIYLVEALLPGVMDEGVAELQVIADDSPSNRVPIHVSY